MHTVKGTVARTPYKAHQKVLGNSGLRFVGPLPASGSTGPGLGPSTLINVVGKRNLNSFNVYLR